MRPGPRFPMQQATSNYDDRFTIMDYVPRSAALAAGQEQAMFTLAFLACGVSLLTAPLELTFSPGYAPLVIALLSKCVFVLLGIVMINCGRPAHLLFAFSCCIGVLFSCIRVFGGAGLLGPEIAVLCIDTMIKLTYAIAFGRASFGHSY
ncbi:hypothetical protein [Burkholderia sp. S171]|uniref:hypothetical protein n=1 Tax=Burkholderia sp. S171 TaxID=1641860 RepID=UPI00131A65C7|nr:hypothetical protein [Burkholderia sp. S171]